MFDKLKQWLFQKEINYTSVILEEPERKVEVMKAATKKAPAKKAPAKKAPAKKAPAKKSAPTNKATKKK